MGRDDELTSHTNPDIPTPGLGLVVNGLTTHTNTQPPDQPITLKTPVSDSPVATDQESGISKSSRIKEKVLYKVMCSLVELIDLEPRFNCLPVQCHSVTHVQDVPKLYKKAFMMKDGQKWKDACIEEMESLKKNSVWSLVDRPDSRQVIWGMWLFKKKNLVGGGVKHKAQFVTMGNAQVEEIDYTKTFPPTGKPALLRLLVAVAVIHGWTSTRWTL